MNLQDTLLAYSEWLDSERLIVSDHMSRKDGKALDGRSHDELAREFIAQWKGAPLAGDEPMLGLATTQQLVSELDARVRVAAMIGQAWPLYRTVDVR